MGDSVFWNSDFSEERVYKKEEKNFEFTYYIILSENVWLKWQKKKVLIYNGDQTETK